MAAKRIFVVTKRDTVEQVRDYIVRAHDKDHAKQCVDAGMFVMEGEPETVDTLDSETLDVTEIDLTA
jgi:hypothetical protein